MGDLAYIGLHEKEFVPTQCHSFSEILPHHISLFSPSLYPSPSHTHTVRFRQHEKRVVGNLSQGYQLRIGPTQVLQLTDGIDRHCDMGVVMFLLFWGD